MKHSEEKITGFLIYLLILAFVLLAYYYLAYTPLQEKIDEQEIQRELYQEQYGERLEYYGREQEIENDIADMKERISYYNSKLDNKTALNIADEVYKAMKAVGLDESNVTSVNVGEPMETEDVTLQNGMSLMYVAADIGVTTNHKKLMKFIKQFEEHETCAFYVSSVSSDSNVENTNKQKGIYAYTIRLTYYYAGDIVKTDAESSKESTESTDQATEDNTETNDTTETTVDTTAQ